MKNRAAGILDTLTDFGTDADGFGADLCEIGRPKMENEDRSALPEDVDPRIAQKIEARRMIELAQGESATAKLAALPQPGEAVHVRMDGSFVGVSWIDAILNLLPAPATIKTLYVASLSFNRSTGQRILDLIDAGKVGRCVFLSSSMFAGKEKFVVDWLSEQLTARGSRLVTARNHCKLLLAETTDGRFIVMEGSQNLRSCYCYEQCTFVDDAALFHWHASFVERM